MHSYMARDDRFGFATKGIKVAGEDFGEFDAHDSAANFASTARKAGAPLVAVTGAEYFIGAHVVKMLLENGAYVRAVVTADDGGSFLRRFPSARDRLQLITVLDYFSDDEDVNKGLRKAFRGANAVVHALAAAPHSNKRKNNLAYLLVDELERVLEVASIRGSTIRRLVYISSELTVYDPSTHPSGTEVHLTEKDWYDVSQSKTGANSLAWSHTVAEERLWNRVTRAALPFTVCSVIPSFVLGPILTPSHIEACPSLHFFYCMLEGVLQAAPPVPTPPVDVRDIATACVQLIDRLEVSGRILLCAESMSALEMAEKGAAIYPRYPWPTTESTRPNWTIFGKHSSETRKLLKAAPFAAKNRRWQRYSFRQDRARTILGMDFRTSADTIRDTVDALVQLVCISDKRIDVPDTKN